MEKLITTLSAIFTLAFAAAAQPDISFQHELQRSIDRGIASLEKSQDKNGYWTSEDHPAVTAIVLVAYHSNPRKPEKNPVWVEKAHAYLLKFVQKNL